MFLMGLAWPLMPVLIGAFVGIGLLVLFCWTGSHVLSHLMMGNDPQFQAWVRRSDPWFDTLPPPFNNDSFDERFSLGCEQIRCACEIVVREPFCGAFETCG